MSYKVRMYRCEMVRDGSVNADTRKVESATDAEPIFRAIIGNSPKEHVVALFLSARGNIAGAEVISVGTLTASLIHPREIFAPALALRAAGLIVCHNHPSGDPTPSREDKEATERLRRAGEILGVPLMDHIILADGGSSFSFRAHGLL